MRQRGSVNSPGTSEESEMTIEKVTMVTATATSCHCVIEGLYNSGGGGPSYNARGRTTQGANCLYPYCLLGAHSRWCLWMVDSSQGTNHCFDLLSPGPTGIKLFVAVGGLPYADRGQRRSSD